MSSSAIQVAKTATYLPDLVEGGSGPALSGFWYQGLIEELESFSPITDYTGKLELHFIGSEYRLKRPATMWKRPSAVMRPSRHRCM